MKFCVINNYLTIYMKINNLIQKTNIIFIVYKFLKIHLYLKFHSYQHLYLSMEYKDYGKRVSEYYCVIKILINVR